jgi:hypothetical protein
MTRILLLCFGISLLACSGDEEPVGAGSSGGAGASGKAGSTGAGGAMTIDGAAGSSAGTSEPGDSAQDRSNPDGADTSSDAPPGDAPRGDAALDGDAFACPPQFDGGGSFPDVLRQGIWLIGWSGGLDHYSWLKFNFLVDGGLNGLLLVKNAGPNDFFFPCEGNDGLFSVNPDNLEVVLQFPQSCADAGYIDITIKFPLCYGGGGMPKGSLRHAAFQQAKPPNNIDGYMFPLDYCGVNFTSCPNPFAPDQ